MEEYYTVNQAAITLKIHPLTVRRYIKQGKLKAFRVGGNIRIALNDLRAFIEGFIPQTKISSAQITVKKKCFSYEDSLFRVRAKGLSMSKLEMK